MLGSWLSVCLLPSLVYSVNITFYQGKGCSGPRLFGDAIQESLSCHSISGHAPTNSSSAEDFVSGQEVFFYADTDCQQEVFSSQDDVCYLHTHTTVKAVKVRSAPTVEANINQATANSSTKDLALYEMPASGDKSVAAVSRLPLSNFYLGVSTQVAAAGITLGVWGAGCFLAFSNVDPVSITLCALSPVSTVLTYAAAKLHANAASKFRSSANFRLGQITDVKRSAEEDQAPDVDNSDDAAEQHVGFMEHDTGSGNQTSPVYEFLGRDGETYHAATFHNVESDSPIHRIYPARHAVLDKRDGSGYLSVRVEEGGLDIAACNYNEAANTAGLNGESQDDLYDLFYRDLECLVDIDELLEAESIYIDLYVPQRPFPKLQADIDTQIQRSTYARYWI